MKKYMPVLLVFTLFLTLLGFSVNSASAVEEPLYVSGCRGFSGYSITTGESCARTVFSTGCRKGDVYSPTTGQRCPVIDSGTSASDYGTGNPRTLTIGSRGADVKSVQQILKDEGYSIGKVDGIYGRRTVRAVREFQYDNELEVTGNVNSETWATLSNFGRIADIYPNPIPPTIVPPYRAESPIISGVKGPQSLSVNEQGTWTINAYDYSKGDNYLSYSVNWGDHSQGYAGISAQGIPFVQSSTFTHSYQNAGVYTPIFTVRNSNGKTAQTSLSVNVGNTTTQSSVSVISPNGGETWTKGTTQRISWQDTNNVSTHEIKLVRYNTSTYYTIANTQGSSYDWSVGKTWENADVPEGSYKIFVCQTGSAVNCDFSDSYFKINSDGGTGGATLSASLLTTSTDRAGIWDNFGPGIGNGNRISADWNWNLSLKLSPPGKGIKAISIKHNNGYEAWSTSKADIYGKPPYPLVVFVEGGSTQLNTTYDNLSLYQASDSTQVYKLFGQVETAQFSGAKLIVDFTDGTSVSTDIPASSYTPPSVLQPSITILSPNGGETWVKSTTNYPVNWRWTGNISAFNMYLRNSNGARIAQVGSNVISSQANYGSEDVGIADVPEHSYILPGSYKFEICSFSDGNICDQSDNYFTLAAPTTTTIPSLIVRLDASTPMSSTISPGSANVTFAAIRVSAGSIAVNNLNNIQVGSDSYNAGQMLQNLKVFDGTTQIGSTAGVLSNNGSYYYAWIPVSGVSIPAFTSKIFKVVADVSANASGSVRAGIAGWNFSGDGANVTPASTAFYGNTMSVIQSSTPVTPLSLSATLNSTVENRAGAWGNFAPGVGNANKTADDWNWTATLSVPSSKTIKSMKMDHGSEHWSTDGTADYPLVIVEDGAQLNYAYGQTIIAEGTQTFRLFGQKESTTFSGSTLTITFTDGTSISASIPAQAVSYNPYNLGLSASAYSAVSPLPAGCSSKFGFSITTGLPCFQ